MIMPYVTPEASFDPDNITPEVSFDPASDDEVDSSSKLDAIISENTELKTQLFNKQQELEALTLKIDMLQHEHKIAMTELEQQLRLEYQDKFMSLAAV